MAEQMNGDDGGGWIPATKKKVPKPKNRGQVSSGPSQDSVPYDNQDWAPVVFNGNGRPQKRSEIMKNTTAVKKWGAGKNTQGVSSSTRKLETFDDEDSTFHLQTVSLDLQRQIQQARSNKKMTQQELATACNLPLSTIRDYENGKAIPNGQILSKIGRVLGTILKK